MAEGGKPLSFSKLASDWKGNPRSTAFNESAKLLCFRPVPSRSTYFLPSPIFE
jgi:hypothetical protein